MNAFKLNFNEVEELNFHLIAIHTPLDDYRLAFFINKVLQLKLAISKDQFLVKNKHGETNFSHFYYEDNKNDLNWDLFQNKSKMQIQTSGKQDLFNESNMSFSSNFFLLPEFKTIDFLIKINDNESNLKINEKTNLISSIEGVSAVYLLDLQNIKSKNNLIF